MFHNCHLFIWCTTISFYSLQFIHNRWIKCTCGLNCNPLFTIVIGSCEIWGVPFVARRYHTHKNWVIGWSFLLWDLPILWPLAVYPWHLVQKLLRCSKWCGLNQRGFEQFHGISAACLLDVFFRFYWQKNAEASVSLLRQHFQSLSIIQECWKLN